MKRITFLSTLALLALTVNAQSYKEGYVDWGEFGTKFSQRVINWTPGQEITEDDNFFISRVKPKERFRNAATQVRSDITESNDKKILFWVPIDDEKENAIPNGVFDSEVFSMWQYLSHYGNWTAPQGRIPGNFADVAHKNGVAVSSVAGVPYGGLYGSDWETELLAVGKLDAEKAAKFLRYYGLDGLGYNSEFTSSAVMPNLIAFHKALTQKSLQFNPIFENAWYDGTSEYGSIMFDQGFGTHNDGIAEGAALFFNYNWSSGTLLQNSVNYAKQIGYDPIKLYAGFNMQGGEPKNGIRWPHLANYPISIGLWGAHSQNMFWESRHELGSNADVKQRTYMLRTERWFTGGTRNPANCPEVTHSLSYNAENYSFHGMSSFMTAKSTLAWNLDEEPFITYFNLGNGIFFNWKGERQHNGEWYNIGVQDYLPTWRWWFSTKLLSGKASDVASNGLDAEFTWEDAYVGGSTLRIFGSTTSEYLHLFKTKYAVKDGDVITLRYKHVAGSASIKLVLTATGKETTSLGDLTICKSSSVADEDIWVEKSFTVGSDIKASELALVALKFDNAKNLNMYLGEFSIVRKATAAPATPVIASTKALAFSENGVDAKIIFNMKNNKAAGEPCYNIDVNTSLFKLYAQQEGCEPILMGITTSWAGLVYNIPMQLDKANKVRLGVAAVSLDMKNDSDIAWGSYMDAGTYTYNDNIQINKSTIKPNEDFEISFVDPRHEDATWTITDAKGTKLQEATGKKIYVADGLESTGTYNLTVKGNVYENGNRVNATRTFGGYIQITSEGTGALPKILTFTANDKEADVTINVGEQVNYAYTGRKADGAGSQGVDLQEKRFGVKCGDLQIEGKKSFSTAFWLKINKLAPGETQLLAVANKLDAWPKTDWGWIWVNVNEDGSMGSFTFRGSDATQNNELRYKFEKTKLPIGSWFHLAFTFDYNEEGKFRCHFYVNGTKQDLTKWNRSTDGDTYKSTDPGYQGDVYSITSSQVLSVGGSAHSRNGIDGVIDNFQVWNKVMTEDDVKKSMGDIKTSSLPSGLAAFWNLETKASDDYTFNSFGTKEYVKAGMHDYKAGTSEGQGYFEWVEPVYTSGSPFISGTAFPVVTKPTLKVKKAEIIACDGSDTAGSAIVKHNYSGDYVVTLTLANSLGSDQRTFQVIKVEGEDPEQGDDDIDGVEEITVNEITTYTIDGAAIIEFAKNGNYNITVHTVAGQKVAETDAEINAGENVQIAINAQGTYILTVKKDGNVVRSVKLMSK